jgi:mRNA interferase RelE/StbE
MAYSIIIKPSANKSLLKLPKNIQTRILNALQHLADNPRPIGSIKLQSSFDLYRIRIGDYRVIYSIDDQQIQILIATVGHRKDIYDSF